MNRTENAIEVRGLVKRFGDFLAVDHLDLDVGRGEFLAMLGPNGAGKSTTLKIMATLVPPTEGSVVVHGHALPEAVDKVKPLLGLVPQEVAVYDVLSARRNLAFFGAMYGLAGPELSQRVDHLLEKIKLADRGNQPVWTYSGGMQRRVNIAAALVHRPQIVFLDEPTVGLDPELRDEIWELIQDLRTDDTSIILTTHYMEEAEALCDRVLIMDRGQAVAQGTPDELIRQTGVLSTLNLSVHGGTASCAAAIEQLDGVSRAEVEDGRLRVESSSGSRVLPQVIGQLQESGAEVQAVEVQAPNLGAVYRHFTGRDLDAASAAPSPKPTE